MTEHPRTVGVVVVNYGGGALTMECLHTLVASDWPADALRIVLVDNPVEGQASDGVADRVEAELPGVRVVRSTSNVGFAGGCNLGLAEVADTDFVALVNNDATVTPAWLGPLVDALDADPSVGAACPKILFATPFVELTLTTSTHRRGRGDRRDLGVRVSGARVAGNDCWTRSQLVSGFWGTEPMPDDERGGQWTSARATLRLPAPFEGAAPDGSAVLAELRLAADGPTTVTVALGDASVVVDVGDVPAWHAVPLAGPPVEIVNNAGTVIFADGHAADRAFQEPDDGRYDEPTDVDAWCGAGVLLTRRYVDDLGGLDERLFLYYEDVEASLRGRALGWRYRYVPSSVIRHVHSATSTEGSRLARYFNERNRLLVLARYQAPGRTIAATGRALLVTASYARRDVLSPALQGRRPDASVVATRLRAIGGFLRRAPGMRRRLRSEGALSRRGRRGRRSPGTARGAGAS